MGNRNKDRWLTFWIAADLTGLVALDIWRGPNMGSAILAGLMLVNCIRKIK